MLKLNLTKEELDKILDKVYFSEVQERIIVYDWYYDADIKHTKENKLFKYYYNVVK